MYKTRSSGFALLGVLVIALVILAVVGGVYIVWKNNSDSSESTTKIEAPEAVTQPSLKSYKTISASFSRPEWKDLPDTIKQWVLDSEYGNMDCEGNLVTITSDTNNAVGAKKAGNFIEIAVGCAGAEGADFKFENSSWVQVLDGITCEYIQANQYPIELIINSYDPNVPLEPVCYDSNSTKFLVEV